MLVGRWPAFTRHLPIRVSLGALIPCGLGGPVLDRRGAPGRVTAPRPLEANLAPLVAGPMQGVRSGGT